MKSKKAVRSTAFLISLVLIICLALSGCNFNKNPDKGSENNPPLVKTEGTISDVSDISKVYDGKPVSNPSYTTNNSDGTVSFSYYVKGSSEGISAPVNAGEYTVKISITEGSMVKAVSASCDFAISKAVAVYNAPDTLYSVKGKKLGDIDLSLYNLAWLYPETVINESGKFQAQVSVDETNYFPDSTIVEIFVKTVAMVVSVPKLDCSFEYDGETHTVSTDDIENFDENYMTIVKGSTLSASATGTYTITIRLSDRESSCWEDGTNADVILTWNIGTFSIVCAKGTADCYTVEKNDNGETTVTFGEVSEKTEYSISGALYGNIVISVGDANKFELSLSGMIITSLNATPIVILSGDEVTVSAKKDTLNYIYDKRDVASEEDYSAAIYSKTDLVIGGKGSLTIISDNNNGIHTKDDLEVKNLTLNVTCSDNALKGNDSVTITSGTLTLIATRGDGIKTSNTDLSSKGKQRGTVSIVSGTVNIYAACDGIDAAYNVEIAGGQLNVFTDKYSEYSEEVTAVSGGIYYIKNTTRNYNYSVKYYNNDGSYVWKNATYYTSQQSGGRPGPGSTSTTTYYYKVEKPAGYSQMSLYGYSSLQTVGQDQNYAFRYDLTVNNSYDTMSISSNNVSWTNYTTAQGGFPGGGFPGGFPGGGFPGGMQDGNQDKGDHSTKGIKADNEILISGGAIIVKSYDDAIHTNSDTIITSTNTYGTGNIVISGGTLTLYSNDDGIHADGTLTITDGNISVINSYEGLEGSFVRIEGGNVSIKSSDDGVNATSTTGEGIVISGGTVYVCAGGDGLDANSTSSYDGILFAGGRVVVINTSGGNSPIDTEKGYKYTGGYVVAIGPSNSMWDESIKCNSSNGFNSVGCYKSNVSSASYINVTDVVTIKMPQTMTSVVIVLGGGTSNAIISTASNSTESFDSNGVCWKV